MIIQDAESVEFLAKAFTEASQFLGMLLENQQDPMEIRLDDDHAIYMEWEYRVTGLCVSFDGEYPPSYSCGINHPKNRKDREEQAKQREEEEERDEMSLNFDIADGIPDEITTFLNKKR